MTRRPPRPWSAEEDEITAAALGPLDALEALRAAGFTRTRHSIESRRAALRRAGVHVASSRNASVFGHADGCLWALRPRFTPVQAAREAAIAEVIDSRKTWSEAELRQALAERGLT